MYNHYTILGCKKLERISVAFNLMVYLVSERNAHITRVGIHIFFTVGNLDFHMVCLEFA